jgi:hypothetical protein
MGPSRTDRRRSMVQRFSSSTERRCVVAIVAAVMACSRVDRRETLSFQRLGVEGASTRADATRGRRLSVHVHAIVQAAVFCPYRTGRGDCVIIGKQGRLRQNVPNLADSIQSETRSSRSRIDIIFADSIGLTPSECWSLAAAFSALTFEEDRKPEIVPDAVSWMFERLQGGRDEIINRPLRLAESAFDNVGRTTWRVAGYSNGAFRRR